MVTHITLRRNHCGNQDRSLEFMLRHSTQTNELKHRQNSYRHRQHMHTLEDIDLLVLVISYLESETFLL